MADDIVQTDQVPPALTPRQQGVEAIAYALSSDPADPLAIDLAEQWLATPRQLARSIADFGFSDEQRAAAVFALWPEFFEWFSVYGLASASELHTSNNHASHPANGTVNLYDPRGCKHPDCKFVTEYYKVMPRA